MVPRLVSAGALALASIWLPWWAWGALALGGILFYQDFFEAVIIGLWSDLVYLSPTDTFWRLVPMTASLLVLLLAVELVRHYVHLSSR